MLAIAVSLTFALSALLAIGVIALTLHQQAPSVRAVIAQARATHGEREIAFSSKLETQALAAAFAPVVRPRRAIAGTVSPLPGSRRSTAASPFFARSTCSGPLCAAA